MKASIDSIETFGLVDGPGIRTVIFFNGCKLRCKYCHNPEMWIKKDNNYTVDEVVHKVLRSKPYFKNNGGVTFSGGEPLVQDTLLDAIKEVKSLGFKIGLHTGGYRPEHLVNILPFIDWVGLDIKAPFDRSHYQKIIGVDHLKRVEQSLDIILKSGIDFECRTTCDPRFLTSKNLFEIAKYLKSKGVKKYFLQKYRPVESDKETSDYACENIFYDKELIEYLKENFTNFEIRK